MGRTRNERGAVAVEFALIAPVLLLLLIGMVEFGRIYNAQLQLTAAARESVRVMAIQKQVDTATGAAVAAAPHLSPALTAANVQVSPTSCAAASDVTVTITYSVDLLSGLFADAVQLTGKAVMRCGG
ncbi:TadE/TadG family type IV pilus assembly protein [Arthrobacter sp. AFG20]|uniref:TadE/TadG family type IV pilus assembly protein n=1 Tax=Arthrobacter sp. AFG20 TaxID=1688671 RepID=UPI000C9DEDD8|nr:TadE family protein [Arthrobacter sp. AFG20]PNH81142.1 pilus assembly protein TadE [Arthrobacter sp. AFG20]